MALRFEMLQQLSVQRRDTGRDGHTFRLNQLGNACGIHLRPRQHQLRADHWSCMRKAPRPIGMEHRRHRQDRIQRGKTQGIGAADGEAMQHVGTVRVEHAFRVTGRARRIEQRGGRQLIEHRPLEILVAVIQKILIALDIRDARRRHRRPLHHQDEEADGRKFRCELLHHRQKRALEKHHFVFSMIGNVGNLGRNQSRINRVPDRPKAGDAMFNLEVPIIIPGKRRNPVAWPDTPAPQRIGQLARTARSVLIAVSMDWTFDGARHDLGSAVKPIGVLQKRRQQQRLILH